MEHQHLRIWSRLCRSEIRLDAASDHFQGCEDLVYQHFKVEKPDVGDLHVLCCDPFPRYRLGQMRFGLWMLLLDVVYNPIELLGDLDGDQGLRTTDCLNYW